MVDGIVAGAEPTVPPCEHCNGSGVVKASFRGKQTNTPCHACKARALAMPDAQIRAGIQAGDPAALRALKAQVDDFVDNDPMLQEFTRQMQRGGTNGAFALGGAASWAPVRGAGDWSEWGDWECWEECTIGPRNGGTAIGPVPTGGWLCWNSANPAQVIGVPGTQSNARKKAEMWALLQNGGKKTRVVPFEADAFASSLPFAELAVKVGAEMERLQVEAEQTAPKD